MKVLDQKKLSCALVVAGLLATLPAAALAQSPKNSINLAVGALPPIGDTKATIVMVEYERLVLPRLSVYGRGSRLKYKFDDNTDVEDGKGTGVGLGVRFFPQGGLKGFFVGGGLSSFKSKWDWSDNKGSTRGNGDSTSIQWGGEVGYRFNLGSDRVSLTPAFNFGSWLGGDDKCNQTFPTNQSCSKESELGFYTVVTVALGFAF